MSRSILLLFILLLLLIGVGIATHTYKESFSNHIETAVAGASPVLANLTAALPRSSSNPKELPQIDTIGRDAEIRNGLEQQATQPTGCPVCKEQCPDMSKYIRRDSIPCWNCSL
jgi:hypothetical protein